MSRPVQPIPVLMELDEVAVRAALVGISADQ
jgi:hypothetical protein